MLFEKDQDLELQPRRTKTLLISIGIHLMLVALVALNPEFLRSTPKRIIRIAGEDYDLSKNQVTELMIPPQARPKPAVPDKPLIQPPVQQQSDIQPPPPPPPPPPPQQQQPPPPPPVVIGPDDVLADGARPDAPPKASRGDTTEAARAGQGAQEPPKPVPTPKPSESGQTQIARNTNPNALRLPNLADSAERIIQESLDETRRRNLQGPRTGLPSGQEEPNFSTEEPLILSPTHGYDFGPYLNQVLNRLRVNWYTLIPEVARLGKKGRVVTTFTITPSGTITDLQMRANSGTDAMDRAAMGSISLSNPFPKLPAGFDGDHLTLQITFLYNYR